MSRRRRHTRAAPWATRAALAALSALAVAAADDPSGADASEPGPRQIFESWFERTWGFDTLESYLLHWPDGISSEFLLARRFVDGRVEIAIDVEAPADSRNQAYLLRLRPDRADELFYLPRPDRPRPTWRVRSLPATQLAAQLPGFPGWLTLLEVRPLAPDEFRHARLPDEIVEGEPCRVIASTPKRDLGFERVELAVSRHSGFALRSVYFRNGRPVHTVKLRPADVREFGKRQLARLRRIEAGNGRPLAELELVNARPDALLPDRLFTRANLLQQRFPSP